VIAAFFSLVDKIDARRRWALRAAPRRRGMGGAAGQRCTPPMDCDQPLTRARHRFRALDVSAARLRLNKMPFVRTIRLNRVFDEAVAQGYMKQSRVLHMKHGGNGKASERRPDFSIEEYRQLDRFMRKWVKQKDKGAEMRYLLRDAVLFLANAGLRYGTEFYNLKWKHISQRDGALVMHVKGKTGAREAIPRANCIRFLRRMQLRSNDLKAMTFEEALKQDKYVFRTASGVRSLNLHQTFRKLMKN
jgi:hypothetical protein